MVYSLVRVSFNIPGNYLIMSARQITALKAPNFELLDQHGVTHSLDHYQGKWLVLFFYPKDGSPGCTKEACNFRDISVELDQLGFKVIGISGDSVESHRKFYEKHSLNYPILADSNFEVAKKYGAYRSRNLLGKILKGTQRNSYIINPDGYIIEEYRNVNPLTHATKLLTRASEIVGETVKG